MNNTVTITRVSPFSHKTNEMTLNMTPMEFHLCAENWAKGALIQDAFPMLNADEREFIKTGITSEEWEAMFGHEED